MFLFLQNPSIDPGSRAGPRHKIGMAGVGICPPQLSLPLLPRALCPAPACRLLVCCFPCPLMVISCPTTHCPQRGPNPQMFCFTLSQEDLQKCSLLGPSQIPKSELRVRPGSFFTRPSSDSYVPQSVRLDSSHLPAWHVPAESPLQLHTDPEKNHIPPAFYRQGQDSALARHAVSCVAPWCFLFFHVRGSGSWPLGPIRIHGLLEPLS